LLVFFFLLTQNWRTGEQNRTRKGWRGRYQWEGGVHIYVNAEMIPVEAIPGIGEGGNKNKYDILDTL
jgi:hypothetical protein